MRPETAPATSRLFDRLPELYRAADEAQDPTWPLLSYLASLGEQLGELEGLLDRLLLHMADPDGIWRSDLSDPDRADDEWLAWLAQLAGLQIALGSRTAESWAQIVLDFDTWDDLDPAQPTWADVLGYGAGVVGAGTGPEQIRAWLRSARDFGLLFGSTWAWQEAIRPHLTGDRTVAHRRSYDGDPWHLRLETYEHETPFPDRVEAAIAETPRPAGLLVTFATRTGGTWGEAVDVYDDWSMVLAGFGTWQDLIDWTP